MAHVILLRLLLVKKLVPVKTAHALHRDNGPFSTRNILCLDCFSVSMLFHIIVAAQNDRQRTRGAGKDEEEC